MIEASIQPTFASWRESARIALANRIEPQELIWTDGTATLPMLADPLPLAAVPAKATVPKEFLSIAKAVSMHRDASRWALLYRVLFRIVNEQPRLLQISVDEDVHRLQAMEKSVRRDLHKMHAFVRFRRVESEDSSAEHYVAFHRPDHLILPAAAPWFAKRFAIMHWTIFTPDSSARWDSKKLKYGPGVSESPVSGDALEELWRVYYSSIFNPARIKINAMKKEMPVRHWQTLPETREIDGLLRAAPARVDKMIARTAGKKAQTSAESFVPMTMELPVLRQAAMGCQGCDLYCNATQTVFGEGPIDAVAMFVGEQPGDQEDLAGRPFVGPAGQVLDEALAAAGVARELCYVTNAVKHFKFEQRGKRRIHSKPNAREINACRPWLSAETKLLKPRMVIALGATAAQSMLGPAFRLTPNRGRIFTDTPWAPWWMATFHPSALLRIPDPAMQAQAKSDFLSDLRQAAAKIEQLLAE